MTGDILRVTLHKRPGETLDRIINLRQEIQQIWRPGVEFATNAYARPTIPTGFDYQATTGGRTSRREPSWPTQAANTVNDGSIVWTCVAPSTASCDPLSSSALTVPTGISASVQNTDPNGDVRIRFSGGSDTVDYSVMLAATTSSGQIIDCEIVVEVRTQQSG